MTMQVRKRTWVDHAHKRIFDTESDQCPPGCLPFTDRMVPSGYVRQIGHMFMDEASDTGTALFDKAGPTPLFDAGDFLGDTLAACPADTQDIQFKAARAFSDAQNATSDGAFRNAIDSMHSAAGSYRTHAFKAKEATAKDACNTASQALTGAIDALVTMRTGKSSGGSGNQEAAYDQMTRTISDGWKGARA